MCALCHHAELFFIRLCGSSGAKRPRWTVKADTLTAGSGHSVDDTVNDAIRAAMVCLVHNREVGTDAYAGPIYFMMHNVSSEKRARELAAALHAALHGDLEPLDRR